MREQTAARTARWRWGHSELGPGRRSRGRSRPGVVGLAASTALLPLVLVGCAGGGNGQPPTPTPTPTPSAGAAAPTTDGLAAALTRIARSRHSSATVDCPGDADLRAGDAVRCSQRSAVAASEDAGLYVAVLDDTGRFVFATADSDQSPNAYSPRDYPPQERSCAVLAEPPDGPEEGGVGLEYPELLYFWMAAGRPASMDDDGNGIPCETVYPAPVVARTLSSPLRAEPYPRGEATLEQVRAYAEAVENGRGGCQYQGTLLCEGPLGESLDRRAVRGSTLYCRLASDVVVQVGGIGLTVLDATGGFALSDFGCCGADPSPSDYPAGATCADLRAPASQHWDTGLDYDQAVYWWALHGMPAALDADGDGRPCEELYPASEVDAVWEHALAPPAG